MKRRFGYITYGPAFQAARVEEREIALPLACAALKGRTLLFISDIHASDDMFPERAVQRLIAQMEALHADMILLGGDYAESAEWEYRFFDMLCALRPPLGAYAVLGNNDMERFADGLAPLYDCMTRAGVTPLVDRTARIRVGDASIAVAGLSEFVQNPLPEKNLFHGGDAQAFRILLAHYPHSIACHGELPGLQPQLSLAGHTHGGQIRLFGLTPYSLCYERRLKGVKLPVVSGWTQTKAGELLVSPGVGTSKLPIRVGVEPTIHRLRLVM